MFLLGYRFIFVWSGLVWPGPGPGSRWPGPGGPVPVPGPGGPVPCRAPFFCRGPVARSRSRSRSRPVCRLSCPGLVLVAQWPGPVPAPVCFDGGGPIPVPVPVPVSPVPVARSQSLPGIWLFYAVLQTTVRSRNHYRTKTGAKRLPKPTA